jgi:hypothetical protein
VIFQTVVTGDVPTKGMSSKVEIGKFLVLSISQETQRHLTPPLFNIADEVINRLLRCKVHFVKVVWSRAASHTNHIMEYQAKVLRKLLNDLIVHRAGGAVAMNEHKFRLILVTAYDGSDEY